MQELQDSVYRGGGSIECERCEKWECIACSSLSDDEYKLLNSSLVSIHWYCIVCNGQAVSAVKSDNLIEEKCKAYFESVRGEIAQVKNELDNKITEVNTQLWDEIKTLKERLDTHDKEVEKKIDNKLSTSADLGIKEMSEREGRKLNMILFNVPESRSEDGEERKKHDTDMLNKIQAVIGNKANLTKVVRIGAKKEQNRPLRVAASSLQEHRDILRSAKKLQGNDDWKEVYISRHDPFGEGPMASTGQREEGETDTVRGNRGFDTLGNTQRKGDQGKKQTKGGRRRRDTGGDKSEDKGRKCKTAHVQKHNLSCIYTNADSLLNKRAELSAIIVQHAPDVICITEFAPKNTALPVQEAELQVEGFDMFSNINNCKRGVLIYTNKSLKASPSKIEQLSDFDENCWCEIGLLGEDRLLVGCVYRSPNSDSVNNAKMISNLRKVCEKGKFTHLLVCGDFNMPEIDWIDETTLSNPNHQASVFMECLRDCFLFQHVKLPTHQRSNQAANILDLILTNEEGMVDGLQYNAPLGKSDHVMLNFIFKCYIKSQKPKPRKYKYDQGNYVQMRDKMGEYDWEADLKDLSCEESWNLFSTRVRKEMNTSIPKTGTRVSKPGRPLWMNATALGKVKKPCNPTKDTWRPGKAKILHSTPRLGTKQNGHAEQLSGILKRRLQVSPRTIQKPSSAMLKGNSKQDPQYQT